MSITRMDRPLAYDAGSQPNAPSGQSAKQSTNNNLSKTEKKKQIEKEVGPKRSKPGT